MVLLTICCGTNVAHCLSMSIFSVGLQYKNCVFLRTPSLCSAVDCQRVQFYSQNCIEIRAVYSTLFNVLKKGVIHDILKKLIILHVQLQPANTN